jgi:enoyl-CoA hydratase/carnithine racemase
MFERVAAPATFTPHSLADFDGRFTAAFDRRPCRVILITGGARYFCMGMDLDYITGAYAPDLIARFGDTLRMIRNCRKPVLACVEGDVVAGGMALLAVADMVVASEAATFRLPEVTFGVAPTIAMACLRERIAPSDLKFLVWTSSAISASRAREIGLVDYVSKPDLLEQDVLATGKRLACMPPSVLGATRTMLGTHRSFDDSLDVGCELLRHRLDEPEVVENIRHYRDAVRLFDNERVGD